MINIYQDPSFNFYAKYKDNFLKSCAEIIVRRAEIIIKDELKQEPLFKIASTNLLKLLKKDLETKHRQEQITALILSEMDREETKNSIKRLMRGSFRRTKIKNDFDGKLLYEKDKSKFHKKINEKLLKIRKEEGKLNEYEALVDKMNQIQWKTKSK